MQVSTPQAHRWWLKPLVDIAMAIIALVGRWPWGK
jgi:hypothetical protein